MSDTASNVITAKLMMMVAVEILGRLSFVNDLFFLMIA